MEPLKDKGLTRRPKQFMGRGRSFQEIKANRLPSSPSSPTRDQNRNPLRPLYMVDDELDNISVSPPTDGEFPRVPSPPPSPEINLPEAICDIESRNDKVSRWKLSSDVNNSNAPDCLPSTSKGKLKLGADTRKTCSDECGSSCSAGSYCSNPTHIDEERCVSTIAKLLEDEQVYRQELWSKLPTSIAGENKDKMKIPLVGLPFCYLTFQKYLQAKWTVVKLQRMENILNGEYSSEEVIPEDWLDMDLQFEKVYGPMDRTSERYQDLLLQFKADRLKMMINMIEKENQLLCEIIDGKLAQDGRKKLAQRYASARLELEEWLKDLCEAFIGVNPYTSPVRMDFFVLPRPTHSLDCYDLTASEVKNFVEFQKPNETKCTEGYNAAVLDVGIMNPKLIVGKFGLRVRGQSILVEEEKEIKIARQILKHSKNNLRGLDVILKQYPVGIEEKVFFNKFRISMTLFDDESVFEGYSDGDGIRAFPDSFFLQKLGKDGRVILFPGILEGQIITPEEILQRIWKRIRFLLEVEEKPVLNLGQLCSTYEEVFNQPIYPLEWGFENETDFAQYSLQLLGNEFEDLTLIENHQVEEFLKEELPQEEEEEATEDEFPESLRSAWETLSKQEWFPLEEPLDAGSVFEIHENSDSLWDSRFFEMN